MNLIEAWQKASMHLAGFIIGSAVGATINELIIHKPFIYTSAYQLLISLVSFLSVSFIFNYFSPPESE